MTMDQLPLILFWVAYIAVFGVLGTLLARAGEDWLYRFRRWRLHRDIERRYNALTDEQRERVDNGVRYLAATLGSFGVSAEEAAERLQSVGSAMNEVATAWPVESQDGR